ncbi:SMC-Scp complex subunit ScpB [Candidatus Azambacteria bacterium]|nr:SMC-Scp complex subunit ScpB [Candidatus Azambacteria bacterium]
MSDLTSKIESILFISGDAVHMRRLRQLLPDAPEEQIREAVAALAREYQKRGVRVFMKDDRVQMVTAPENAGLVDALVKSHLTEELTPAALETLSCVAYREPITKAEIDDIRGVNSIFSLRALMMRGLVKKSKDDAYRVTIDFLKKLGIENISDLPDYEELRGQHTPSGGAA